MNSMNTEIELKEQDLELVVSEKTLGHLVTNAKEIRDMVKSSLPKYDISNYNDDNIAQAKKDKATLNKAAKALNSKRIEIEKEFMKPFGEFKEIVAETVGLIGECSSKIDAVVKQNEQRYKDGKLKDIRTYFDGTNTNGIDFGKVFKTEWLNKSGSMKSVCAEIDGIQSRAGAEIETLKGFGEDFNVLLTYYMGTLDITSTLQYANRLKEQRERAKHAEEERRKAEEERIKARKEASDEHAKAEIRNNDRAHLIPATESGTESSGQEIHNEERLYTRAFKVTATKEQIIALCDYMNENGIDFEKIEL